MLIKLGIFGISLFIMFFLSKYLVDALMHFSRKLRLSEFYVGSVILALGTSMPELIDNIVASTIGLGELGVGDIIGSNITNICLVLAVTALITPIRRIGKRAANESLIPLLACLLYLLCAYDGVISRLNGVVLLVIYFGYQLHFRKKALKAQTSVYFKEIQSDVILAPIAVFTIIICGWLAVNTGASLAQDLNIPLPLFGLTILAISTSLPELSASIIASLKGHSKLALGNIFGSNVINLLLVGGVASLIRPIVITNSYIILSSLVLLLIVSGLLVVFIKVRKNISRKEALVLLLVYVAYLIFLAIQS